VPTITEISAGGGTTCGLTSQGTVWCWGSSEFGENGSGILGKDPTPRQVSGLVDATQVKVGFNHACALRAGGGVVCWGWANYGAMGDGISSRPLCNGAPCAKTPVSVSGLSDAIALDATWTHTCAVRRGGTVVCWGDDRAGQIGDGPGSDTCQSVDCRLAPATFAGASGVTAIATGAHFTLALTSSCELFGSGLNTYATLGTGDTTTRSTPALATRVP
jgi:alpha-tubulin suppressor-like RCC1 family protein